MNDETQAAVRTLRALRYTWEGGEVWRPPLGPVPPPVQTRKLVDLPLGVRFRFPGNPDTFVLIDRHDTGRVVREPDINNTRPPFQGFYSATETAEEFREITVEVLP
jgi:hypothetical protein